MNWTENLIKAVIAGQYDSWEGWGDYGVETEVFIEGFGEIALVESPARLWKAEGQSDTTIHLVFKVTLDSAEPRYFRKSGYLSSYDGAEWDGAFVEVEPVKDVITYRPINGGR